MATTEWIRKAITNGEEFGSFLIYLRFLNYTCCSAHIAAMRSLLPRPAAAHSLRQVQVLDNPPAAR